MLAVLLMALAVVLMVVAALVYEWVRFDRAERARDERLQAKADRFEAAAAARFEAAAMRRATAALIADEHRRMAFTGYRLWPETEPTGYRRALSAKAGWVQ